MIAENHIVGCVIDANDHRRCPGGARAEHISYGLANLDGAWDNGIGEVKNSIVTGRNPWGIGIWEGQGDWQIHLRGIVLHRDSVSLIVAAIQVQRRTPIVVCGIAGAEHELRVRGQCVSACQLDIASQQQRLAGVGIGSRERNFLIRRCAANLIVATQSDQASARERVAQVSLDVQVVVVRIRLEENPAVGSQSNGPGQVRVNISGRCANFAGIDIEIVHGDDVGRGGIVEVETAAND